MVPVLNDGYYDDAVRKKIGNSYSVGALIGVINTVLFEAADKVPFCHPIGKETINAAD